MHITPVEFQNQIINSEKLGVFENYFSSLKIGSMLNKSGIIKGASPMEPSPLFLTWHLFGKFFKSIVRNKKNSCQQRCRI